MILFSFVFFILFIVTLIFLDISKKINLMKFIPLALFLFLLLNRIVFRYLLLKNIMLYVSELFETLFILIAVLFLCYLFIRLNIFPLQGWEKVNLRLKIMKGGRFLIYTGLLAIVIEILFLIFCYPYFLHIGVPESILAYNTIWAVIISFFLILNGVIRIFFTSRHLSITRCIVIVLTIWIPILNFFMLLHICRVIYEEYDFACHKENLHLTPIDSDICKTKYPVIMVHGVMINAIPFFDLKYFNYWGRIPKELIRCGAAVYYDGIQSAAGAIANNAEELKKKILQVIEETGCQKVNIIAHSKGGLDARYAVSALNMENYVASLTTICTPHHGSSLIDFTNRLPEKVYLFVAKKINMIFARLGDKNPDFYTAVKELSIQAVKDFNNIIKDSPAVYYQSYIAKMKNVFSDIVFSVPYSIIKHLEGDNDGFVSASSAVWGNSGGIFELGSGRGISHGDMIDYRRKGYKGFDVLEAYVKIVSELKNRGY